MGMKIFYWSGTGNTEAMAELIAKGIEEGGETPELINISSSNGNSIEEEKIIILGCPAMGDEILEEDEFKPFMDSIENDLKGKKVCLFGSYGWGDGQWMRDWEEYMTSIGVQVSLEPVIVNYSPEGDAEEQCIEYGRNIAKLNG